MTLQHETSNASDSLLDQVIAQYLMAESEGKVGDLKNWVDRYPAIADRLVEFLQDRDGIRRIMVPLQAGLQSYGPPSPATHSLTPAASSSSHDTVEFTPKPPTFHSARYRTIQYHAGGGMGEIWLADDDRIGRQVAVKKLRANRVKDCERFQIEAQITGQLEHPSIVPLHDLGVDDAGQPYYVMKFIKGRRLREDIAQFHLNPRNVNWAEDVEFRRLLDAFVKVCQVVAYAHCKGVLHRDIKPDNIMLGEYGETLVIDWGLAKVMDRPEEVQGSYVHLSGGGSTATQEGAIVGSPFYMPPEGAEGNPEAVDRASDVYLLGATLYEILTGKPPRSGSSNWELIDLARHTRPAAPRKTNPHIPRPLEAICLKAMEHNKRDRYPSATQIATDVEAYLAGAPVSAYPETTAKRAWRWAKRNRRVLARSATALVVASLALVAFQSQRAARELQAGQVARSQLAQFYRLADDAQFFAASTFANSEKIPLFDVNRARQQGQRALAISEPWGDRAQYLMLEEERPKYLSTRCSLLLSMAHNEIISNRDNPDPVLALSFLEMARRIQPPTRGAYKLRSQCNLLLGKPLEAREDMRLAEDGATPISAHDWFLEGESQRMSNAGSSALATVGEVSKSHENLERAIDNYRRVLELEPRNYWARFQLGRCLFEFGRTAESIEALSTCIALRPESPWAYSARGLAQAFAGQPNAATADLDRAIELDPEFEPARLSRGFVRFWLLHDAKSALNDFDALLRNPDGGAFTEAAFYRGQLFQHQGKNREALADFDAVLLANPDFKPAYWQRGKTKILLGDKSGGIEDIEQFAARGQNGPLKTNAAKQSLGEHLRIMGQQLSADVRRDILLRAAQELESAIKSEIVTQETWQHLGAVYELLGESTKGIETYAMALEKFPDSIVLHNMRGWAFVAQSSYDKARADFEATLRLEPKNAEAHAGLGFVSAETGQSSDANRYAAAAFFADADNYLTLHNIACIFARLAIKDPKRKLECEDLALAALERAVFLSSRRPGEADSSELTLIENERAFSESLSSRAEFKRLLNGGAAKVRTRASGDREGEADPAHLDERR
jgi:serine/threonine protein kinase/Tfp pilus assembly protein PilF